MRAITYGMLHDRFAHEIERRFEVLLAVGVAIVGVYTLIYHVF